MILRRKRILYGLSGNVLTQVVNVITQFVGIPIFLIHWGVQYYGEWLILFTIPNYIALCDFGMGVSATAEMSILKEQGKFEETQGVLRSTFWIVIMLGAIPCLILMLSIGLFPWYELLNLMEIPHGDFRLAFLLLIVYVFLSLALSVPVGYYRVEKEYHRERFISALFRVLEFGGLIIIVIIGKGIVAAALTYLIVRIGYLLFVLIDLNMRYADFKLSPVEVSTGRIKHLIRPSFAVMKILIGQTILVQGVTTAIGIVLGPVQVVIFNTIRTLLNTSKQAVNLINMSLVSEFSYAYGAGQKSLLNKLFVRCQQLNVSMSFILLVILLLLGGPILNIWTNDQIRIVQPFYAIFIAATFINSFWNGPLMLLVATNKTVSAGNAYFTFSIAILVGIILLMSFGGLTTVGLMLGLFEIIMCIYVLKQSDKLVEWNLKSLWKVNFN